MALHYSQGADLQEKLKPAVESMENAEKTRTDCLENPKKLSRSPSAKQIGNAPTC
jgi:hypothetical protein